LGSHGIPGRFEIFIIQFAIDISESLFNGSFPSSKCSKSLDIISSKLGSVISEFFSKNSSGSFDLDFNLRIIKSFILFFLDFLYSSQIELISGFSEFESGIEKFGSRNNNV